MKLLTRKSVAVCILASFVCAGIMASKPPVEEKPVYKNLKVLSNKISDENMDYVMETFNSSLGVNCMFCHPSDRNEKDFKIDFVTDKLENKRVAREMLKMTITLNKKYFKTTLNSKMTTRGVVWCKTCHKGTPVPLLPTKKS